MAIGLGRISRHRKGIHDLTCISEEGGDKDDPEGTRRRMRAPGTKVGARHAAMRGDNLSQESKFYSTTKSGNSSSRAVPVNSQKICKYRSTIATAAIYQKPAAKGPRSPLILKSRPESLTRARPRSLRYAHAPRSSGSG